MATARYSNHWGSKSRQNPFQVRPPENIGNLSASRRYLWVRTTASTLLLYLKCCLPVFQNLSYKLQRGLGCLSDELAALPIYQFFPGYRGVTQRQLNMRHSIRNASNRCQTVNEILCINQYYLLVPPVQYSTVQYSTVQYGTVQYFQHAITTSYQEWVWEKEAYINWSMVTCQGSTRSELP